MSMQKRRIFTEYSIGEFSKHTGLGIHTLRYYEKEGLLIPARKANNRRCYSNRDAAWAAFIKRLKATGMPVREIARYAQLRAEGDPTLYQRMEMLLQHRQALKEQIAQLQGHLASLDEKIDFYRGALQRTQDEVGPAFQTAPPKKE